MSRLPRRDRLRLLVLIAVVGTIAFLPVRVMSFVLPALSPLVSISALLSTREIGWPILCALPVLALVLWRRRAFCRHVCPTGFLLGTCAKVRRKGSGATYSRVPALGYWAALLTLGGAFLSFPLFLLLDPIGILSGAVGGIHPPLSTPRLACAAGLAGLVAASVLFPALWCTRLCPLGGMQDFIADIAGIFARRPAEPTQGSPYPRVARRAFLGIGAGAAASGLGIGLTAGEGGEVPFRPPGAIDASCLKVLCIRCNNCARVCPTGIIRPSTSSSDPVGLLTPVVNFKTGSCLDSCNQCGLACPTGAIAALTLREKNDAVIGLATINQQDCVLRRGKECVACITTCKRQAIREDFSKETYSTTVSVDEDRCNGCGACLHVCPGAAITMKAAR